MEPERDCEPLSLNGMSLNEMNDDDGDISSMNSAERKDADMDDEGATANQAEASTSAPSFFKPGRFACYPNLANDRTPAQVSNLDVENANCF